MAEPKPIASLTSGLLARKGAAQPAMRRPMLGFGRATAAAVQQDDLGWNDMGFDVSGFDAESVAEAPGPIGLTPMPAPALAVPPVVAERKQLAKRVAATIAPATAGRKAAFTLRLDAERHLKLRLAVAVTRRSAQQIVTQALDELLDNLPEIDRLTKQLPLMRDGQ